MVMIMKEQIDKFVQGDGLYCITLTNYSAGYSKQNMILKNINLNIPKNKIVLIIGANYSGKSTILNCIEGQLPFEKGKL